VRWREGLAPRLGRPRLRLPCGYRLYASARPYSVFRALTACTRPPHPPSRSTHRLPWSPPAEGSTPRPLRPGAYPRAWPGRELQRLHRLELVRVAYPRMCWVPRPTYPALDTRSLPWCKHHPGTYSASPPRAGTCDLPWDQDAL